MIEQYVSGELTGQERIAFEKKMQEDPMLAQEVDLYRSIGQEIRDMGQAHEQEQALRNNLQALNKEYFQEQAPVVKMKRVWWIAGAAAAAAAILLFVIKPFSAEKFSNEKLFSYYTEDVAELSPGQRGGADDSLLARVATLYNKQEYSEAIPLLETLINRHPADNELLLAKGISQLKINQPDSALVVFNSLINGQSVFKNQGLWYKALALLKQNKLAECAEALNDISPVSDRYKLSQQLLKKIKKQLNK